MQNLSECHFGNLAPDAGETLVGGGVSESGWLIVGTSMNALDAGEIFKFDQFSGTFVSKSSVERGLNI